MKQIIINIVLDFLLKEAVDKRVKKAVDENNNKWKKRILSNPDIHKTFKLSETELLDTINKMFDGDGLMNDEECKGFTGLPDMPQWFPVMSEERLIDISFVENKKLNPKILVEIAEADPENYYYNIEKGILYGKVKVDEEYIKILCREGK